LGRQSPVNRVAGDAAEVPASFTNAILEPSALHLPVV